MAVVPVRSLNIETTHPHDAEQATIVAIKVAQGEGLNVPMRAFGAMTGYFGRLYEVRGYVTVW
jgi:hypothetical protein